MLTFLAVAAFASGFVNTMAGGGVIFPALLLAGIPAVEANASSTVILFPVQFVSAFASRSMLKPAMTELGSEIVVLITIGLTGGAIGAMLLFVVSPGTITDLVPWLLLVATLIFGSGALSRQRLELPGAPLLVCRSLHFLVCVYGGFFGGGVGILVLAVLRLCRMQDIRFMKSVKVVLSGVIGATASTIFALSGHVRWREVLLMMIAASLGGYCGTRLGGKLPRRFVEGTVMAAGFSLSAYFFVATKSN
jgi:uncharacterized protein